MSHQHDYFGVAMYEYVKLSIRIIGCIVKFGTLLLTKCTLYNDRMSIERQRFKYKIDHSAMLYVEYIQEPAPSFMTLL